MSGSAANTTFLSADVNRRFDVVNRGLSGYNTSQALKALPQIFTPLKDGGPKIQYLVSPPFLLQQS